jgi:RNA polymerase primary sigma factor
VHTYLREIGRVPLLNRQKEVKIAKRIERGQLRVLLALSRSPVVIRQILTMGPDLKDGASHHQKVGMLRPPVCPAANARH